MMSDTFEQYSYLWLDNMEECLRQFLTYGRQLTVDEQETLNKSNENNSFIKETSLRLEDFKTQVHIYLSSRIYVYITLKMSAFDCSQALLIEWKKT